MAPPRANFIVIRQPNTGKDAPQVPRHRTECTDFRVPLLVVKFRVPHAESQPRGTRILGRRRYFSITPPDVHTDDGDHAVSSKDSGGNNT